MWTADEAALYSVKAALFLLALLRCTAKQRSIFDRASLATVFAVKCLTAPFAWQKSIPDTLEDYDQSEADADDTMSFAATLQFWFLDMAASHPTEGDKEGDHLYQVVVLELLPSIFSSLHTLILLQQALS